LTVVFNLSRDDHLFSVREKQIWPNGIARCNKLEHGPIREDFAAGSENWPYVGGCILGAIRSFHW
jgi:hypothetical protein